MAEQDREYSLLDLLIVLARHKRLVLGLPLATAIAAVIVSLLIPNTYTGTTKILPPQQTQSNAVAILGQLGAVGQLGGTALGLKNPSDVFVAMLKSRTVADAIVTRFELRKTYDKEFLVDARKVLEKRTDVSAARNGVITIEVEDRNPKRAAEMANAYVAELEKLTLELAVSEASQRRLFFEKQLKKSKDDLTVAEVSLKQFQEESGLIKPQDQAGLTVSASAGLRAQITAKEVQLAAMRSFATDRNPELIRVQQELAGLRTELGRIEKEPSQGPGDLVVSIGRVPGASLEYVKKFRDVKYYETLFELLARQYELARLDEAKNATLIQVLDKAVEPEKKSGPRRARIVVVTAVLGLFAALFWVFVRESGESIRNDPARAEKLEGLKRLLRLR